MLSDVTIFEGGLFEDQRGQLQYVNDFTFKNVRRFYRVCHTDTSVVRAWQGHKIEQKYFYVVTGSFVIAWVKIDDWENPSKDLQVNHIILSTEAPRILHIPPGYANGLKALAPGSTLLVYSDLSLEDSSADRWSFDSSLWLDWTKY